MTTGAAGHSLWGRLGSELETQALTYMWPADVLPTKLGRSAARAVQLNTVRAGAR